MPWKRGFIFSVLFLVLFSTLCLGQQSKTDSPAGKNASITGTVVQFGAQTPLKNVQVSLIHNSVAQSGGDDDDSSSPPELTVKTDEKGQFKFSNVAPGSYYVRASHAGMALKSHHWQDGVFITLEPGKAQTLELIMAPTAAIQGQVLNEEGEPMQNVSVMAMRYGYTTMGRHLAQATNASTDDKGQFRLFGLQPGSYLVAAGGGEGYDGGGVAAVAGSSSATPSKQNQTVYTMTYYPNESSPEHATPIVLKPGDEAQASFTLTRVPAHNVSGTVAGLATTANDKSEVNFRMVMAMREGYPAPAGMAMVGKDSTFKIRNLPAAKYKIVLMRTSGDVNSTGSADVVVESSDVTGVVIAAESSRREVTGLVRAEGENKPDFSQLFIIFSSATDPESDLDMSGMSGFLGGSGGFGQVKSDGSFKVSLSPSAKPYNVTLAARGKGLEEWFTSKVLVGGKDVLESGFKPGEGTAAPVEVVISNKGAAIEGTVLDKDQKPFPGADVVAFPTNPKLRRRMDMVQNATADQQGRFKLRGVRPGEYIVFAVENSQEQPFTTDAFQKTNSGKIQTVKLEAGGGQKVQLEVIREQGQ
jgi:uncharacterized GH25 family protein